MRKKVFLKKKVPTQNILRFFKINFKVILKYMPKLGNCNDLIQVFWLKFCIQLPLVYCSVLRALPISSP
jgi:hypothetical protein